MQSVNELMPQIGLFAAWTALAMNRSFVYRERARGVQLITRAALARPATFSTEYRRAAVAARRPR